MGHIVALATQQVFLWQVAAEPWLWARPEIEATAAAMPSHLYSNPTRGAPSPMLNGEKSPVLDLSKNTIFCYDLFSPVLNMFSDDTSATSLERLFCDLTDATVKDFFALITKR